MSEKSDFQDVYYYMDQLQDLCKELPLKYQQRLPYELLSDLAKTLLNPTIFEIVQGLQEIQHGNESKLFDARVQLQSKQRTEKQKLSAAIKEFLLENSHKPHEVKRLQVKFQQRKDRLNGRQKEELARYDMQIVSQLDQKVRDQQITLEKAGVPGFFVTDNPVDIQIQIYLLGFIAKLQKIH